MAGYRLPERRRLGRPGVVPLVVALTVLVGGVALQSSVVVAAQESGQLFRCETEEDLDGSACRVDMLPDAALAEMVYERGFDPEGADRLQLLDAVVQLLDYESATGEDLREMVYIPDDDGSAAAAAADAELEAAAIAAATATALAADEAAETSAEAAAQAEVGEAAAAAAQGGAAGALSGDSGCAATNEHAHFDEGGADGEASALPSSGGAAAAAKAAAAAEAEQQALREVIEESSSSSSSGGGGEGERRGAEGQTGELVEQGSVIGYTCNLVGEVLQTMKRDLNAVVGFLPAPVAKPIREVAAVASDTAVRFVAPALRQAERYTRGLRREAGHAAGRAAMRLKDDVGPWIARGIAAGFGKAKRRLGEAVEKRRGRRDGGEGEEEEGRGGAREGQQQKQ